LKWRNVYSRVLWYPGSGNWWAGVLGIPLGTAPTRQLEASDGGAELTLWQKHLRLEWFLAKWEHNEHTKVQYHIINSSRNYYNLGSHFKFTKGWSPKDASRDKTEFAEVVSLTFRTSSSP
jgi:hypothetical protein